MAPLPAGVAGDPFERLWRAVHGQQGDAAGWHLDNLSAHERRYRMDLAIVQRLAPRGTVLEVGAAPCQMTALLRLHGHRVAGVDVDPARVADFIAEFGLDVRRCDFERQPLPFADASVACALLCETFEHLRIDPAFVLSEINRVLELGAPLLLTTPNVYSLPSLGRFLLGRSVADPATEFGKLRTLGHMGHVREYSAREVARFLGASGFAVQSLTYRSDGIPRGLKRRLLHAAYRVLPARWRREIVIVAVKVREGPRLEPLVPLVPLPAPA